MNVRFTKTADKELKAWIKSDRSSAKKIYDLISDIQEHGLLGGRGHPEQLKYYQNPARFSRHINRVDRLVYSSQGNDILIISCKGHYDDT